MDRIAPDSARTNPEKPYLPWPKQGWECLTIRQYRRRIERQHATAEGVTP